MLRVLTQPGSGTDLSSEPKSGPLSYPKQTFLRHFNLIKNGLPALLEPAHLALALNNRSPLIINPLMALWPSGEISQSMNSC